MAGVMVRCVVTVAVGVCVADWIGGGMLAGWVLEGGGGWGGGGAAYDDCHGF